MIVFNSFIYQLVVLNRQSLLALTQWAPKLKFGLLNIQALRVGTRKTFINFRHQLNGIF
jgi:hypothetical protein